MFVLEQKPLETKSIRKRIETRSCKLHRKLRKILEGSSGGIRFTLDYLETFAEMFENDSIC